jgi:dihydropteroate synthase
MNFSVRLSKTKYPLIMGILNVTPDSFSDGGKYNTKERALARAKQMEREGADILDIGGESTGPGSKEVSLKEELNRVLPVIRAIRAISKVPLSVDTYKARVAEAALHAGADMINDVTALRGDADMARVIAKYRCPVVLMYAKDATARTAIKRKRYKDVIKTIKQFLRARIDYAQKQGVTKDQIITDPGMGHFVSATPRYSYEIIARLRELTESGYPILVGISRKSFLGGTLENRDERGLPITGLACINGACIIRTHEVWETKNFLSLLNMF